MLLVVIVEVALRLVGMTYRRNIYQAAAPAKDATDFVLCVGDSHTFGVGAPTGRDYPSQLAALLNNGNTTRQYQVINLGFPGYNSSQAVDTVLDFFRDDPRTPHVVVFNAGKNNDHNLTDARIFPEQIRRQSSVERLRYLFAESRAYRLGQITIRRLENLLTTTDQNKIENLGHDQLLDMKGAAEREILHQWIGNDLSVLMDATKRKGVHLVLLNYWQEDPFVDTAFINASENGSATFVDVRRFGRSAIETVMIRRNYLAEDLHPNEFGYAIIADQVFQSLRANALIPPPAQDVSATIASPE